MRTGPLRVLWLALPACLLLLTGAESSPERRVSEIPETYKDSLNEFLRGRYEAAASGYRYLLEGKLARGHEYGGPHRIITHGLCTLPAVLRTAKMCGGSGAG